MALKPIYNSFHPLMKQKSEPVEKIDDEIKQIVEDLYDTLYGADNGIGLAAPQIGVLKRIVVIDLQDSVENIAGKPITLINPEIIESSEEEWEYQEGCLSVPTLYETVYRPKKVTLKYTDINGEEIKLEADELLARVIQHEIDHLDGILFYERLTPVRRALSKSKLKKIQKGKVKLNYPMVLPDGTKI